MGEYSISQLYVMILVSLAIITVPAIAMGAYWWWFDRKHAQARNKREERPTNDFLGRAA